MCHVISIDSTVRTNSAFSILNKAYSALLFILVENLIVHPVGCYKNIEEKTEEGTTNRTVASTNMNATSSRAHTIVGITFVQKSKNPAGQETAKTARVNLVDLAGR